MIHRMAFTGLVLATAILGSLPSHAANEQAWRLRAPTVALETTTGGDIAEEIRFGREVAARIIGQYGLYANDQVTRYVTLVGLSLGQNANRPELNYHFAVLNTSVINAYAAPGGYVFVTRGALEKMQNEAELAGVLAHELIHVNEKHIVRELGIRETEGSPVSGLARLIGGGSETARIAFTQAIDKAVEVLFRTGYTREDEVQADKGAVVLSAIAGYDPNALVHYFERINEAKGKNTEVLDKTHPIYSTRITLLKDTIAKEGIANGSYKTQKDRFVTMMRPVR